MSHAGTVAVVGRRAPGVYLPGGIASGWQPVTTGCGGLDLLLSAHHLACGTPVQDVQVRADCSAANFTGHFSPVKGNRVVLALKCNLYCVAQRETLNP